MKLFDIENDVVIVNDNVLLIKQFKAVNDKYGIKGLAYIRYMVDPESPFDNIELFRKADVILEDLELEIDNDCFVIQDGMDKMTELYSTHINRLYESAAIAMDNLSLYLRDAVIEGGREGNFTEIKGALKDLNNIRKSFEETKKARENERKTRGGKKLAYDQIV